MFFNTKNDRITMNYINGGFMSSVTQRLREIKQPKGGYINIKQFDIIEIESKDKLSEFENIHPSIIGLAVDYMTRFLTGASIEEAFKISIKGAQRAVRLGKKKAIKQITRYLKDIDGLDDISIESACKAVTFDVWYRSPFGAMNSKDASCTNPDALTISNIRTLVERSLTFFEQYGPVVVTGFGFEPNGYNLVITKGDGDFLTADTLWDFKVSRSEPKRNDLLQLLIYYIMGKHSGNPIFDKINKIGIFNPRLNKIYLLNVDDSWQIRAAIECVEKGVICY